MFNSGKIGELESAVKFLERVTPGVTLQTLLLAQNGWGETQRSRDLTRRMQQAGSTPIDAQQSTHVFVREKTNKERPK